MIDAYYNYDYDDDDGDEKSVTPSTDNAKNMHDITQEDKNANQNMKCKPRAKNMY